jgi:hypothetical protein
MRLGVWRWREELRPTSTKKACEDVVPGRRENCDPQLRMVLIVKHLNLSLEFWSGVSSSSSFGPGTWKSETIMVLDWFLITKAYNTNYI